MVEGKTENVAQPENRATSYWSGSNRLLISLSKGCSKKVLGSLDFQKSMNLAIKVISSSGHGLREWPALISIQSSLFGVVSNNLEHRVYSFTTPACAQIINWHLSL